MKAKVGVATVSGKAYFLIVNELKKQNVPFFSLMPGQPVPLEAKVIITTEKEKHLINHDKVLVYNINSEASEFVTEAMKILLGKETYERVMIGIDPGEVFGIAIIADGNVIKTANCFSVRETLNEVQGAVKDFNLPSTIVTIKIGNGFPECRDTLLEALDQGLPSEVVLEVVSEAGTNRSMKTHRRGLRDIVSAIRIAGRNGYLHPRRKTNESNA